MRTRFKVQTEIKDIKAELFGTSTSGATTAIQDAKAEGLKLVMNRRKEELHAIIELESAKVVLDWLNEQVELIPVGEQFTSVGLMRKQILGFLVDDQAALVVELKEKNEANDG